MLIVCTIAMIWGEWHFISVIFLPQTHNRSLINHKKNIRQIPLGGLSMNTWPVPWILIVRTESESEAPILWPSDGKRQLIGKDCDAGKDWRPKEKGVTEDEMVRWHQWLNGHEFEQALGDSEAQGSLACCSPWGCKELDTTWRMNNNNNVGINNCYHLSFQAGAKHCAGSFCTCYCK